MMMMMTFYSFQRRNSGTLKANIFAREEDRMTLVGSNVFYGCPHGADPLPHLMRPPELDPLCVDIISGWPIPK